MWMGRVHNVWWRRSRLLRLAWCRLRGLWSVLGLLVVDVWGQRVLAVARRVKGGSVGMMRVFVMAMMGRGG